MIINLVKGDTELRFKSSYKAGEILILCDTSNGDLEINLLDATGGEMTLPFKVKGGGTVFLTPLIGQYIDEEDTLEVTDKVTLKSDLHDWWVI